ncbi:MAG: hypothetical protein AMJ53_02310 [Gammaproteobacteria bacterium SG8_11]|nr:MAG: hypothetical protein AMJ53_02310 [Gammaproteobacteria bacterium SG8_11]
MLGITGCAVEPEKDTEPTGPIYFPAPPDEPRFVFERTVQASSAVEQVDSQTRMRQMLTGESSSGTVMSKPFDVAVCQGLIFVSDTVLRSVLVFDVPGKRFYQIGAEETALVRKPLGLATDEECNLYIADGTTRQIMIFNQAGQFLKAIGGQEWFERLSHVTVSRDGSRVFAVDTGNIRSTSHHVRVFDGQNGKHLFDIGERGEEEGKLNLPRDAELGPDGNLYVVDGGNFRVQVFDQQGKLIRTIGTLGRRYGQFARPKGIAIDPAGNIYVSDAAHGNFQIFSNDGKLLLFVGKRSESFGPANYMLPAGIDVDEDGRIYMVDQYFRKLDVYRPVTITETEGYVGAWQLK